MTTAEGTLRPTRRPALTLAWLLAALLVVDLLFIAISVDAQRWGWSQEWLLRTDRGRPEQFGYAKQATTAALLLVVWRRTGWDVLAGWAALFGCILLDDSLRLHENVGGWLSRRPGFPQGIAGVGAQDLGELAVWGLLGLVPLAVIAVLHRRGDRPARAASGGLVVVVGCYAVFGVVVDQLHALTAGGPLYRPLGVAEDGGELLLLSVAVVFAAALLPSVGPTVTAAVDQRPVRAAASASSSPA